MGILNVTPDSFSDGGRHVDPGVAFAHALRMVEVGADMIDVGGESTRPGAGDVDADEQIRRVVPVIRALAERVRLPISIDTTRPEVMCAAIEAGAGMVNDIRALREPGALQAVARTKAAVCLMHMQGEPRTMQGKPRYADVVVEVCDFLDERVRACVAAGIPRNRLVVDPGIGFGKHLAHNLALLAAIPQLRRRGQPVLIGVSRKSMFGELLGRAVDQRLAGSLACAVSAVMAGANIVRAHDVAETADALRVVAALREAGMPAEANVANES